MTILSQMASYERATTVRPDPHEFDSWVNQMVSYRRAFSQRLDCEVVGATASRHARPQGK